MKAIDDTPTMTEWSCGTPIQCPHCRRLLNVFLKEAS